MGDEVMKTKKQRLEIYKKMLEWFKDENYDDYFPCFCSAIRVIALRLQQGFYIYDFPELMKYKPDYINYVFWFEIDKEGIEKRKQILRKIIKEMT